MIWGGIFYGVNAVVHFTFLGTTMTTVSIALMNTLFRLATVIALTPMIGLLEKIVCMLFPERDATPGGAGYGPPRGTLSAAPGARH